MRNRLIRAQAGPCGPSNIGNLPRAWAEYDVELEIQLDAWRRDDGICLSNWDGNGEMPVNPEEAVELAQAYLNRSSFGLSADEHADLFYGYYTIHTLRDGEVVGMVSVHGDFEQVFTHT